MPAAMGSFSNEHSGSSPSSSSSSGSSTSYYDTDYPTYDEPIFKEAGQQHLDTPLVQSDHQTSMTTVSFNSENDDEYPTDYPTSYSEMSSALEGPSLESSSSSVASIGPSASINDSLDTTGSSSISPFVGPESTSGSFDFTL